MMVMIMMIIVMMMVNSTLRFMHHVSYSILWVNVFTRDVFNDDYVVMIVIIIKMMTMIMLDDDADYNDYDNGVDDEDDKFHNDIDFM